MSLSPREINQLRKIVQIAEKLIAKGAEPKEAAKPKAAKAAPAGKRMRRSGPALVAFRKMLKAERKRGVSVADLAKKHGISPAYIYQL